MQNASSTTKQLYLCVMKDWGNMKLLIDTNVVLDVLLRREPFFRTAAEVLNLTQRDEVREYVSASAITDIYYIANIRLRITPVPAPGAISAYLPLDSRWDFV